MPNTVEIELPRDYKTPRLARHELLRSGVVPEPKKDDVSLIVSELVSNSVKYGDGSIKVVAENNDECFHCEIIDEGQGFFPEARSKSFMEPGGWGLPLVEALTDRWGVYRGSTHVWFEIDLNGNCPER